MQIFVDADAFPNVIKDILIRASVRFHVPLVFVANQPMRIEQSAHISTVVVPSGPDLADDRITELAQPGDLVITDDIPLADRVVNKGGFAISLRGKLYTEDNIKDRLAMRNLMNELRGNGMITGGPPTFSRKDREAFANKLNSFLTKHLKTEGIKT
ncbi:MAG: YaiI/YqxD family protein [Syntrophaceae bacterium]